MRLMDGGQLARKLGEVVQSLQAITNGVDTLNGKLDDLVNGTDLLLSLDNAGINELEADEFKEYVSEWYNHRLTTADEIDMLVNVINGYITKLGGDVNGRKE